MAISETTLLQYYDTWSQAQSQAQEQY